MTNQKTEPEVTPDDLMAHFRGRSLKSIITFTIIVHVVVLVGTSVPFLVKSVLGTDTSGMSEEERIESAVRQATASLKEIAEEHGMNPQDLSGQFAGGAPRKTKAADPEKPEAPKVEQEPEKPKSAIEKELEVKVKGPALPSMEDEEEDLFK